MARAAFEPGPARDLCARAAMIVTIHQPQFIPWPGYFYKIIRSDKFVLYDNVQFPRGKHFGNRNMIKTANGPIWLTVPVRGKSELLPYNRIQVDPSPVWRNKHARTLELSYKSAPHYDRIIPQLVELYRRDDWSNIAELDEAFLRVCLDALDCKTSLVRASQLKSASQDLHGVDAILSILREVGATQYISGRGAGSLRYVESDRFEAAGIELFAYDLCIPVYPQARGEFIPDLSIVDLIANVGAEARSIIEKNGSLVRWVSA
jgi:hypothetical protein